MLKKILTHSTLFLTLATFQVRGQIADSTAKLTFSGYVDAYYAYYTDSIDAQKYQQFPSVSPRSNQFGLNTAMVTASYDASQVRALVTLHYGDIAASTWSSTFNPIMEAHAGIKICEKLWLDAGFFRTHVGTEGLLPKENITSSVSVNTYFEPYYESGAKLTYTPNEKLVIALLALNGYNIFEENNRKKSVGLLVNYAFNKKFNIGYSNYSGDDTPQGNHISHFRVHNSIFLNYQSGKIKAQAGGDLVFQEHAAFASGKVDKISMMQSGVLSIKYFCTAKTAIYARGEFFSDEEGFMSGVFLDKQNKNTGLKIYGGTIGVEYKPTENSYIRLEARDLTADKDQEIFYRDKKYTNTRIESMINIGVSF